MADRSGEEARLRRPTSAAIVCAAAVLAVTVAATLPSDNSADAMGWLADAPWAPVCAIGAVLLFTGLHFTLAAVALRFAAAGRFSVAEASLVQLVAAAANRVTPVGIGGAGVNARYLVNRESQPEAAVTAVAAVSVLGGFADMVVLLVMVAATAAAGVPGIWSLATGHVSAPAVHTGQLPWLVTLAPLALGVGYLVWRRIQARSSASPPGVRHGGRALDVRRVITSVRAAWSLGRELLRQPRRVAALMTASAGTTLALAGAFTSTAVMLAGSRPPGVPTLFAGYLVAGVLTAAVPLPGAGGSTDAALAAVLLTAGVPLPAAVRTVVAFRVVTYWAPAGAGLVLARNLRRRGAL